MKFVVSREGRVLLKVIYLENLNLWFKCTRQREPQTITESDALRLISLWEEGYKKVKAEIYGDLLQYLQHTEEYRMHKLKNSKTLTISSMTFSPAREHKQDNKGVLICKGCASPVPVREGRERGENRKIGGEEGKNG